MAKMVDSRDQTDPKKSIIKGFTISAKCRRIIKYCIAFVCAVGLIIQVTQLVWQYLERRTIVHLEFETLWYNRLPSITICYPFFIAMNKTVEKFPELKPRFAEYKRIMSYVTEDDFYNDKIKTDLNDIYDEFVDTVKEANLSFDQWSQLGIPFFYSTSSKLRTMTRVREKNSTMPITVVIDGLRRYENGSIEQVDRVEDFTPIESVVYSHTDMAKCFTFFSHLKKPMREYQMNIKSIQITIRHHKDWFPPTLYEKKETKILFAMHSSNGIPQNWDTFMELRPNWYYEIRYNRWKTKLLGPPYKTNCIDYDMDSTTDYKIRSDCVNHCITQGIDKICFECDRKKNQTQCQPCFVKSDYLWRVETARIDQDTKRKFCPTLDPGFEELSEREKCIDNNQEKISHDCEAKCRPECRNRYYNFAVFSKETIPEEIKVKRGVWEIETKIYIGHNQLPDSITEHIEEMSFVAFAGNFGGLFGIWMGLSTMAILHFVLKFA